MGMLESLPNVFGVQFTGDRWLSVAPSSNARGTFDRKELLPADSVALAAQATLLDDLLFRRYPARFRAVPMIRYSPPSD